MTAPETPLPSPPGMKITEENKLKGSLFIEAYGSLIDGIGKDAESETEKALDITFNAIGAASATVMLAIDPLGSIIGAGVGWLIEHVSFLRDALNQLMGNPEEIQANVEANKARAAELRALAEDHKSGLATFDGWTGTSSERFKTSMDGMYQELDELANAVETKAKIVAIMGMLVTVLRDIVRDLIAQLIGSLIGGALLAAAAMIPTFGASIPIFCGFAVGKAVALGTNIASRVARVVAALGRQMKRIGDLDDIMAKISKGWQRFENGADAAEIGYEGWKAQNEVDKKVDEARGGSGGGGGEGTSGTKTALASETLAHARVGTVQAGEPAAMSRMMATEAGEPMQALRPMSRVEAGEPMQALRPMSRVEAGEPMQALRPMSRVEAGEPMQALQPTRMEAPMAREAAQPMQALQATRVEAVEAQPLQAAHRVEAVQAQPMQAAHRMEAVQAQPFQAAHRVEAAEPMQAAHRVEAVQAQPMQVAAHRMEAVQPMQPMHRVEAASDSTMVSGVSMTAGTPVHEAAQPMMQAREMYSGAEASPAEPMQQASGYEPMGRTQMSHTFEALEPTQREGYNPLVSPASYSVAESEGYNPLMAGEPVQPAAGYEAGAQSGGAPLRPAVAHERPTRQPE